MKVQSKNHKGEITYHYDIIQNTQEWHEMRAGRIGGTSASTLLVKGKSEDGLGAGAYTMMYQKVHELLNGVEDVVELKNDAQQRGHDLEPIAKKRYEEITNNVINDVGYISQGILFGCSPDGLVGDDGGVEIKCPMGKEYVRYMTTMDIDKSYFAQVQWCLYITGRSWWDFIYFHPDFKNCDCIIRRFRPHSPTFELWDKNTKIYEQRILEITEQYKGETGFRLLQ